jgi:hypothetical protein
MIKIKDLNDTELSSADLGFDLKTLSNLEQQNVYGGLFVYVGCTRYFVK